MNNLVHYRKPSIFGFAMLVLAICKAEADTLYVANRNSILNTTWIGQVSSGGHVSTFFTGQSMQLGGLAFDAVGNLYAVKVTAGSTIERFAPDGTVTTFANLPNNPLGLAFDSHGYLFASIQNGLGSSIVKIAPDGSVSTFVSGLSNPHSLAFDGNDNLYVSDNFLNTIIRITPDGTATTFASGLSSPVGLAFDSEGNLFVANFGNNTIGLVTPSGTLSTFAFTGPSSSPAALAFDSTGSLYVSSYLNNTISRVAPDGSLSLFATGLQGPDFMAFQPVPEPSALALLAFGALMLMLFRRTKTSWKRVTEQRRLTDQDA